MSNINGSEKNNFLVRFAKGFGANAFGQLVTIFIQLMSIPMFMFYWDSSVYGRWIVLSAVPCFLSLADFGIMTVASNNMTIAAAAGRMEEANAEFRAGAGLTTIFSIIAFIVGLIILRLVEIEEKSDDKIVLITLMLVVLLNIYHQIFESVFRASGKYATGVYLSNFGRLVEWVGAGAGLLFNPTFFSVALGMLIARVAFNVFSYFVCVKNCPQFVFLLEWSDFNFRILKKNVVPSLSFMAFPIGNAVGIQGMQVMIGALINPAAVAMFSILRTFARVVVQFNSMLARTMWPEFSRLYGEGDIGNFNRYLKNGIFISFVSSILVACGMYFFSDKILTLWTAGKIEFDKYQLMFLLMAGCASACWQLPYAAISSINKHVRFSGFYLLINLLLVFVYYAFGFFLRLWFSR